MWTIFFYICNKSQYYYLTYPVLRNKAIEITKHLSLLFGTAALYSAKKSYIISIKTLASIHWTPTWINAFLGVNPGYTLACTCIGCFTIHVWSRQWQSVESVLKSQLGSRCQSGSSCFSLWPSLRTTLKMMDIKITWLQRSWYWWRSEGSITLCRSSSEGSTTSAHRTDGEGGTDDR